MKGTIKKERLIEILGENRTKHRKIYEEALEGYKTQAIKKLNEAIDDVSKGAVVQIIVNLPVPKDYTKEYDKALRLFELIEETEIELDEDEFENYVMDEWGWKKEFTASNSYYTASAINA